MKYKYLVPGKSVFVKGDQYGDSDDNEYYTIPKTWIGETAHDGWGPKDLRRPIVEAKKAPRLITRQA